MIDYGKVPVTQAILDAEATWAGEVSDLRDPELALRVQTMMYYDKYIEGVREAVRKAVGRRFVMYGAVSDVNFALWRDGEALRPMGLTFKKDLAKAAKKGVPLEGKKFVIFQTYVELPWIVMRGKIDDEELVVDVTQVSYHTLSVIG
jgi:hypothetical protein